MGAAQDALEARMEEERRAAMEVGAGVLVGVGVLVVVVMKWWLWLFF